MVCLGLSGLILAIFLPSEPPLLTAHFVVVCALTLVGLLGGVLAFIQLFRSQGAGRGSK